ncbi:MAG: DNA polymerase III subunit beta [Candidatus Dadabacteria bacterium]|nr:DNA polymerase III subunit beta [Candidatus Dadabacteria bacterium]
MKFSIDASLLTEKLGLIQGISERRVTMPVLSHVLIETEEQSVKITATDLETTIQTSCLGSVESAGSMALPARKIFEIVKELPPGNVSFTEINNNWVEISSLNAVFKIAGLPGEDFPEIKETHLEDMFSVDSKVLGDMIDKTIYAVTSDELRRSLSGIYFEKMDDQTLRLVATDGHRLSLVERADVGDISFEWSFLVPKKGVSELKRLLRSSEAVRLGCSKSEFTSEGDGVLIVTRLIDTEFPDYTQVIPESTKFSFTVGRVELLGALKRVSLLSSERTRSVKLKLQIGALTLSCVSPEIGEATETLEINYEGDDIEVGFNSVYLRDVLEATDGEEVEVGITDEQSPVTIKPVGNGIFLSVIMPMRV